MIKEFELADTFELQDIKKQAISASEVDEIKELAGSYEAFFSKRARKYRSMGLADMQLTEADYKKYILEEYTFIQRPVIIVDDQVFVGSSKKTKEALGNYLGK